MLIEVEVEAKTLLNRYIQLMQHYFIKIYLFLCCSTFLLEINSPWMYVSVLLVYFSISMPVSHCFNLCTKNKVLGILNLYLFIKLIKFKVKVISKMVRGLGTHSFDSLGETTKLHFKELFECEPIF